LQDQLRINNLTRMRYEIEPTPCGFALLTDGGA